MSVKYLQQIAHIYYLRTEEFCHRNKPPINVDP